MTFRTLLLACVGSLFFNPVLSGAITSGPEQVSPVVIGAPNESSQICTEDDFGAVQIRIGLFATLAACFREVEMQGRFGTAFVTLPREFEDRTITRGEFNAFRADVKQSEDQFRRRSRDSRIGIASNQNDSQPIPLGVFDYTNDRVGYAYAYAIAEETADGNTTMQTMMRTESFVLVNNRVILLMIIAPVNDGAGASIAFDLSENWAKAIVAASRAQLNPAKEARLN